MFKRHIIGRQLLHQLAFSCCRRGDIYHFCTESNAKVVSLSQRSVVEVSGKDSKKLLQGLITNDMNLLGDKHRAIYSMFLNVNGRMVYDLIFYKMKNVNEYLVECDHGTEEELIKVMKKYKLRSKVNFNTRPDLSISCLYDTSAIDNEDMSRLCEHQSCFKDPRLPQLGFRIVADISGPSFIQNLNLDSSLEVKNAMDYKRLRYDLGVSEGVAEISNGIPLEHNLVWLNGVSFEKGCYIGQELVARSHHVGVIRKRIMPLRFSSENYGNIEGMKLKNEKGKNVGKIISSYGRTGIGLMRLKEAFHPDGRFHIDGDENEIQVLPVKPAWWPNLEE